MCIAKDFPIRKTCSEPLNPWNADLIGQCYNYTTGLASQDTQPQLVRTYIPEVCIITLSYNTARDHLSSNKSKSIYSAIYQQRKAMCEM